MANNFVLAAQLSTGHSKPEALGIDRVRSMLQQALDVVSLDILIIGWEEIPPLYQMLTARETRSTRQVYLWYPLLSDYPGLSPDQLVLNYRGRPSQGWGEFLASGEMTETFRFACPNNPQARDTTLAQLERVLTTYNFDGVFLDKIRFPSPANGLEEMFSCFCQHCYQAASEQGLNLDEVKEALEYPGGLAASTTSRAILPGAYWLEDLLANRPVLQKFIRFRLDSITQLVASVHGLASRLGKKLALDVFTPGLAPAVGQDYSALAPYGEWVKPMIYRFAKGPAGLRLELPALADDLNRFLGFDPDTARSWIQQRVPGLAGTDFEHIADEGVPLRLIAEEARQAVALASPTPIYLGLETVSMPGIIHITPTHVEEIIDLAQAAGVAGLALSWDLLHTPVENLKPLGTIR